MTTLLLAPVFNDDSEAVRQAANRCGWQVVPIHGWDAPRGLASPKLAYYGFLRPLFATILLDALGHVLLEAPLDWLATLPYVYRQREVGFTTLAAARQQTTPAFVKPAEDKQFPAQVYASGALLPDEPAVPNALPVLVAEPVEWTVEYRCFVLEGQVVALSPYRRRGQVLRAFTARPAEITAARRFAQSLLAEESLPPAVVLDVGEIPGRGWAAVEANPTWAAALYGCDAAQVLPVLQRACVPAAQLTTEDLRWIVPRDLETLIGHTSPGGG